MMRPKMLKTPVQIIFTLFVFTLLILTQNTFAQGGGATAAGKVVFAMGTPQAIDAGGTARNLARGDPIYSGDRLVTGRGRLQVAMVDGAFISVQPNSEYVLDTYNFDGKTDGTEQATYRLVKGGVRAVTGLIGRVNKDAYKVNTAVATIGIRGTGHNTRLCAGDCGSVKDGLYHNTWEGITYVVNDIDTADVPAGQGVYVEDIDKPIIPLAQPSGVTAVALTKTEEVQEQEDEDTTDAEQSALVAVGDQRTSTGEQTVIAGEAVTPSETISGLNIAGVHPDDDATGGISDFGLDASVFVNPDGDVIGLLGTDHDLEGGPGLAFGTIDYNAALGGDDPEAVGQVGALLDLLDQGTKDLFLTNPAQAAETTIMGDIGWGRWANGYFLGVDEFGGFLLQELVDNQSLHYIFGPEPGTIPTSGFAVYDFIGGTQSTSLSGATIGKGVTDGAILVDFGAASARLSMHVDHDGNLYLVNGLLNVGSATNDLFDAGAVASTSAAGSACNPNCSTYISGGFAGSAVAGSPEYAGLSYEIQESDIIMGVAAFATDNVFSTSTMGIHTYTFPTLDGSTSYVAYNTDNSSFGFDVYLTNDSNGDFIGEIVNDSGSSSVFLTTINLLGMLDNNNATVAAAASDILDAINSSVLTDFQSNPAQVVESVSAGDISLGRWGNGKILHADSYGGAATALMTNDQSYHFVNGPDPGMLPTSGSAYYNFTAATQSTTASGVANASGVAVGSGVTDGTILVDFFSGSGSLDMDVSHGNLYHVTGPLILDPMYNVLYDGGGTYAATTAVGSGCNPDCTTYFYGGLLGPNDTASGLPGNLGLYYEIQEQVSATDTTIDPIMGVAAFGLGNLVGSITQKPTVFVVVQPSVEFPTEADVTTGTDAILHFSTATGEPVGAIMTTYEYNPVTMMDDIQARSFGTIDLTAMQNSDDPAAQTELNTMVSAAGSTAVSDFESNPASVAEFNTNGTIGYGRWANGKVLTYNDHFGSAEIVNLTGNQSIHFIYGPDPGPIPTTGMATYNFMGGTQSTSVSGATIGNGVTGGNIMVDFGASSANLSMTVNHGSNYSVSGPLALDNPNNGLYDIGVYATGGSGACASMCPAYIDGGFAGPVNTSGNPSFIGIEYDIQESDVITGVAGFQN